MLITKILEVILQIIASFLSILSPVTSLPIINGYDIDSALVSGVGMAYNFANFIWPIRDVLLGAAVLWTFHGGMLALRALIGHRAPVSQ